MARNYTPPKVGAAELMALNHLVTPLLGAALGFHEAPEGKKLKGVKEGFKQSLAPALRNDALILALSILGGKVPGEPFHKKVLKRLGASTALALTSKALDQDFSEVSMSRLREKVAEKLKEDAS